MPALPPPSMQIGALAPGFSPFPPTGPVRQTGQNPALATLLQNAGANTSASGPTNISQTVTATQVGTYLVWAVAVSASAASALGGTPTGWTLAASKSVATLSLGVYVFPNNPGGITAVTFSSNATATAGGIASWFWEVDNAPFATQTNASANATSTALASGALTPVADSALILGAGAWVLGTATLTDTSTNNLPWSINAQKSSTGGATNNAALRTSSTSGAFGAPAAAQFQGTLSASSVWAAVILAIPSSGGGGPVNEAPSHAFVIDSGGGYAVGDAGSAGWSLGGTKPGGAGSGQ